MILNEQGSGQAYKYMKADRVIGLSIKLRFRLFKVPED